MHQRKTLKTLYFWIVLSPLYVFHHWKLIALKLFFCSTKSSILIEIEFHFVERIFWGRSVWWNNLARTVFPVANYAFCDWRVLPISWSCILVRLWINRAEFMHIPRILGWVSGDFHHHHRLSTGTRGSKPESMAAPSLFDLRQQSIRGYSKLPDEFLERALRVRKKHERRVIDVLPISVTMFENKK